MWTQSSGKFEIDCRVNAKKNHIFAYYYSLLPIGSDEITKRLQMWLNKPQCGHKEGGKFPNFWWDNHQGKSSHIYTFFVCVTCPVSGVTFQVSHFICQKSHFMCHMSHMIYRNFIIAPIKKTMAETVQTMAYSEVHEKSWDIHEKVIRKLGESHEKFMRKS